MGTRTKSGLCYSVTDASLHVDSLAQCQNIWSPAWLAFGLVGVEFFVVVFGWFSLGFFCCMSCVFVYFFCGGIIWFVGGFFFSWLV